MYRKHLPGSMRRNAGACRIWLGLGLMLVAARTDGSVIRETTLETNEMGDVGYIRASKVEADDSTESQAIPIVSIQPSESFTDGYPWDHESFTDGYPWDHTDTPLYSPCTCAACARSLFPYPADSYQFPLPSSDAIYNPQYSMSATPLSYYERYYYNRPDFVREFFKPWDVYPVPVPTDSISKLFPPSSTVVPTTSAVYSTPTSSSVLPITTSIPLTDDTTDEAGGSSSTLGAVVGAAVGAVVVVVVIIIIIIKVVVVKSAAVGAATATTAAAAVSQTASAGVTVGPSANGGLAAGANIPSAPPGQLAPLTNPPQLSPLNLMI